MNKIILAPLLAFLGIAPALNAQTTAANADALAEQREQARIDRLWSISWRDYAKRYIPHGDSFVYIPNYNPRNPSSTGKTARQYQQESAWQQKYTDVTGKDQTRKLTKTDAEANAAVAYLPKVEPGAYGYIHSGQITAIVDDRTVVLEEIWLIDADQTREDKDELMDRATDEADEEIKKHVNDRRDIRRNWKEVLARREVERKAVDWMFEDRYAAISRQRSRAFSRYEWEVVGFRTASLTEDARWPSGKAAERGLQLVILSVEDGKVTAAPASLLSKGLTEDQFADVLLDRGLIKSEFVDLVMEVKREVTNKEKMVSLVLARIEGLDHEAAEAEVDRDNVNDTVELAD